MEIFGQKLKEGEFKISEKDFEIRYSISKIENGWEISGFIKGRPGRIDIFRTDIPRNSLLLINNWQSWGPCKVVKLGMDSPVANIPDEWKYTASIFPEELPGKFQSDYFLLMEGVVFGFLSSKIAHPFFFVDEKEIVGYQDFFDASFDEYVPLEKFIILFGEDPFLTLRKYADLVVKENGVRLSSWEPVGWCSWYQYFENVDWKKVSRNLEKARDYPYTVFQLDEGYERSLGDWFDTVKDFPSLEEISREIKEKGFRPGIWLAPFSVEERSALFSKHRDWLVKAEGLEVEKVAYLWHDKTFALDLSNPSVKCWLFDLFYTLRKMGYEYFKIDFLFAGAIPGSRQRKVTPIQAYREGLKVIRKAVGNAYILGCGAPLLPSVGIVDGIRIGPDTAPYWGENISDFPKPPVSAKWALRNTITRSFMNKKLWLNDPDCLILRNNDTQLTYTERKMYSHVCGLLDNIIVQSDDLEFVDESGQRLLYESLALKGGNFYIDNLLSTDLNYKIHAQHRLFGNIVMEVDLDKRRFSLERQNRRKEEL